MEVDEIILLDILASKSHAHPDYQLIEKIETLLAEIEILEKNTIYQSGRSYVPINDGDISGNRGVR